jgi:hypothetical protein
MRAVHRIGALCRALWLVLLPSWCAAAPPSGQWAERRFALDGNVGLATPLGELGAWLDYAPASWLSLAVGAGANPHGLQLAGAARLRLSPQRQASPFLGAGYSQGPFEQGIGTRYGLLSAAVYELQQLRDNNRPTPWHHWDRARWLNLELGGEERLPRGFDARGFAGVGLLLNPRANREELAVIVDHDDAPTVVPVVLYLGAAFGFSL